MAQVGPKLVDGTSSSRSARRPSVLPLLGVDLRGRTLDSVEALLLLGVRAGIRPIIMSQIGRGASVDHDDMWSPSLQDCDFSQLPPFAAQCLERHS